MEIKIRSMQKEDLQELADIYSLVYEKFDIGEKWTSETAKKLLSYWFDKQPDLGFVAEFDKKTVGAVIIGVKPWRDGNHLSDGELFVHPEYQKKGIATKLCTALYKKALEKYQVVTIDSFTFKKTKFPLNWYLSQGFNQNDDWIIISGNVKTILSKLEKR